MQRNHKPLKGRKANVAERHAFEDLQWAETALEVRQHTGKLVVVHRKRVIAVGSNQDRLLHDAALKEKCSEGNLVIIAVPPADLEEILH